MVADGLLVVKDMSGEGCSSLVFSSKGGSSGRLRYGHRRGNKDTEKMQRRRRDHREAESGRLNQSLLSGVIIARYGF
jgi:hypothetical protein